MNSEKQVTRKKFLRWSGLAFIGALVVPGKLVSKRDKNAPFDSTGNGNLQAMSRIRPARGAVERGAV